MREKIDYIFVEKYFEREHFIESRNDIHYAQYTTIFVDKERNCRFQRVAKFSVGEGGFGA